MIKNNKIFKALMLICCVIFTLFSFSMSYASSTGEISASSVSSISSGGALNPTGSSDVQKLKEKLKEQQAGPVEMTVSEICLAVGDHFMEYLNFLLKEEVTVEKIIYNKVDALNANFFDKSTNPTQAPASAFIKNLVNTWYDFFRKLVIVIYLVALVVVGIKIMLGGAGSRASAKDLLVKWTMGVAILCLFPYVMRYSFDLNEAILNMISGGSDTNVATGSGVGAGFSDLTQDELEERSPEYVTSSSYMLTLGSEEATVAYINKLDTYTRKADLMRIMRAMAGVTARLLYVIFWFILIGQLVIFIYIYYKRYLMIAFLIIIFPITLVEYVIGTVTTGKQTALSAWCKEFFVNVFLQSIHAIVYGVISSVVMDQIKATLTTGSLTRINWIIYIVAVNFVFVGEKMIRSIINAAGTETVKSADEVAKGFRGGFKGIKKLRK